MSMNGRDISECPEIRLKDDKLMSDSFIGDELYLWRADGAAYLVSDRGRVTMDDGTPSPMEVSQNASTPVFLEPAATASRNAAIASEWIID